MSAPGVADRLDHALEFFTAQTGLTFPSSRRIDFEAGVRRVMARRGQPELDDLPARALSDARLLDELVDELAVGETYFFREPAQFEAIRQVVLPRLASERRPGALLNAWSAGCASGEEPYSLAILLEQEGLASRWRILASDISRLALAKAAKATYGKWSFRGGQDDLAARYFRGRGDRFALDPRFRDRVRFEPINLVADAFSMPDRRFDLVLCRNVLIYFKPEVVKAVAMRIYDCMAEGGWLITAPSDPPLWTYAPFTIHTNPGGALYRKTPAARPVAAASLAPGPPARAAARTPVRPAPPPRPPPATADPMASAREALAAGDTARVIALTGARPADLAACLLRIQALANSGQAAQAEGVAETAASLHPTSVDLHYLRAVLLLGLNRSDEAVRAVRRVLYLDRTLIAAHLLLGSILRGRGDNPGALRAYRNARDCCAGLAADDPAKLTDGESVGRLAEAAAAGVASLEAILAAP